MMNRRIPDEKAATVDEIEAAIEALSIEDNVQLERAARYRIGALGDGNRGRDHEDLLSEAMTRTLSGQRRWNKDVDFLRHLLMVMKSIAYEWRTRSERGDSRETSDDHLDEVLSRVPSPERRTIARQVVEALEKETASDSDIQDILAAMQMGLTGPEIENDLGLTTNERLAAMKRLRRAGRPLVD